jgi:hypothetical protein
MGFAVSGWPAGGGMLDVPRLLEQLRPFPRCATAVLELWPPPEQSLEESIAKEARWVEQSIAYLKPLFSLAG